MSEQRAKQLAEHYKQACIKANAEVCRVLGKALGYPVKDGEVVVGCNTAESLADEAAEKIVELQGLEREVMDVQNEIMEDRCPTDQHHCACVPYLRMKIRELEAKVKASVEFASQFAGGTFPGPPDKDGWYDTMCYSDAVDAGDFLVEHCGWERKEGGSGRRQFYRLKEQTNAQDDPR